jgi:hypothetical protein
LRRAAVQATLAPSVHNTQPWRFRLSGGELRVYADRSRQLRVLDPLGRQLMLSCGCAVLNARAALAADGLDARVDRLPDPAVPDLLARIAPRATATEAARALAVLDAVIAERRTNRRAFVDFDVPPPVVDSLVAAAAAEAAEFIVIREAEHRLAVAALSQRADGIENLNPAYRAELRAWTAASAGRNDGVPDSAVPRAAGDSGDDVPIRDFDTHGSGGLPGQTHSSRRQFLALLCTSGDEPEDWLRAGEALERVLLEVTRRGFAASPLTQVTEVPVTRAQLRLSLGLTSYPHLMLRIGRAPATPATRRRRLVDVLSEDPEPVAPPPAAVRWPD